MTKIGTVGILAAGAASIIFIAGFFHAERSADPAACRRSEVLAMPEPPRAGFDREETQFREAHQAPALRPAAGKGLLALTSAPGYRRAGDLTLRVADCTKAEDDLETKLQKIHGEIVDMLMEGTEGSRTCTLSVVIPADQFRSFIAELRGMGKVQAERITASKLKPGQAEGNAVKGDPDPRELSLVSIRMADEKVAQNVLESRGILASSFDRSASHLLKGFAVIVELVGFVLPFALALGGLALPVYFGMKLRRSRQAALAAE